MSRRTAIAIHLLLLLLLGAPLHYYFVNTDRHDERFAWRMFSPTRIERCASQFFLGTNKLPFRVSGVFHPAWIGLAQRGRRQVIEAMGQRLCDTHVGQPVYIRVQCETHPGSASGSALALADPSRSESDVNVEVLARGVFNFCETSAL